MKWFLAHYNEIVAIVGGVVLLARIIVKLTPTPKDDTALASIVEILKHLGLVVEAPTKTNETNSTTPGAP